MLTPSTTRLILLCCTITAMLVIAPWLASREDPVATGLITQICTSLGIIEAPAPAPAPPPPPHQHR